MKQLKINRKHFVAIDNIEKFVIKRDKIWVYRKKGYPKVYKTEGTIDLLKNRLTNLHLTLFDFPVEYDYD